MFTEHTVVYRGLVLVVLVVVTLLCRVHQDRETERDRTRQNRLNVYIEREKGEL